MITIGITESDSRFHHYEPWLKGSDDIHVITLSYKSQNLSDLEKCDGIVLTGGVDSHPRFYHNSRLDYPLADTFNEVRDEFELKVFEYARLNALPVLGICRGMQLVNIALGGTLIQDLEEAGKKNHRRMNDVDGEHEIFVDKSSMMYAITGMEKGNVNSAHHQALGEIAGELKVTAVSEDDVAEATEYKDPEKNPFLLCVQWHPERMGKNSATAAFTKNIRKAFLDAVKK